MGIEFGINLRGFDRAAEELKDWAALSARIAAKEAPRDAKRRMARVVKDRTGVSRTSIQAWARPDNVRLSGFGGVIWTNLRTPFMQRALRRQARLAARQAAERMAGRIEEALNGR